MMCWKGGEAVKDTMRDIYDAVDEFFGGMGSRRITTYSAACAYYLFMSLVPVIMLLVSVLQYTPLTRDVVLEAVADYVPESLYEIVDYIVTSIYNFHLDLVRLEGEESTVLIDNLRRTVDPDIRRGLQIVKTLRIERREDLLRAADYAGHADYLLLDPVEAAQEWLTDWEAPMPFLLRRGKKEAEGSSLPDFHHPRLAGYCLGEEMEQAPGRIDATKVQRLLDNL